MKLVWVVVSPVNSWWRVASSDMRRCSDESEGIGWTCNLDLARKFESEDDADQWMVEQELGVPGLFDDRGGAAVRQLRRWRQSWWWMNGKPS